MAVRGRGADETAMMTMTMMMDEQVRGVGLLREGGVRVSRPHLDALHTQVDAD